MNNPQVMGIIPLKTMHVFKAEEKRSPAANKLTANFHP
jgi:hypothetical protein